MREFIEKHSLITTDNLPPITHHLCPCYDILMKLTLPTDVIAVLEHLQSHGYEAYIVGGAVRDLLGIATQRAAGLQIKDWDFTTNATPDQIQAIFPESFYENEFGTVAISRNHVREQFTLPLVETQNTNHKTQTAIAIDEATKVHESLQSLNSDKNQETKQLNNQATKEIFEITTFRSDGVYTDFRRPDSVSWGQTLEEDLFRRDFSINAMAIHIDFQRFAFDKKSIEQKVEEKYIQLIDPHDGLSDLAQKKIRTVGSPNKRFQEDALRMLRAIRFAVQLEFDIEQKTFEEISKHASLIKHVSFERVRDEFLKMLSSRHPKLAIELLDATGLLPHILPELVACKGVEQGGHHTTDVWTHSLNALDTCPSTDPIVRLATLLHDIAKPVTFRRTKTTITFYNHEVIGARVAKKIADRLKLSKRDSQRIFILVRHHMFHYQPTMTDAAIRRFMRKVGLENINDILDVRIGDRLGSGSKETSWRLEEMKQRMLSQLHQPFSITDLKINGTDLMTELQLKPGPIIGKILHELFEHVLENPELNEKGKLLEIAKKIIQDLK